MPKGAFLIRGSFSWEKSDLHRVRGKISQQKKEKRRALKTHTLEKRIQLRTEGGREKITRDPEKGGRSRGR